MEACKAPTAPWGSGTEGSLTENVFGLICCLQRKLPAAGSHAEIRQAFICSTPACLEKYVINASKRSFVSECVFFSFYFILIFFSLARAVLAAKPILEILGGSLCHLWGLMVGHTCYPTIFCRGESEGSGTL